MKGILSFFCIGCLSTLCYAISPFSLESLQSVNVTVLNKNKHLNAPFVTALGEEIKSSLHRANIHTSTKGFSNFLIKIHTQEHKGVLFTHVNLSLVENARIQRAKSISSVAITYTKDDFFETSDFEADTKESVLFLVGEFIDQFKEENK